MTVIFQPVVGSGSSSARTVSQDLVARIEEHNMQAGMMGLEDEIIDVPKVGDDLMTFLSNLWFSRGDDLARKWAQREGIDVEQFDSRVKTVNEESQARRRAGLNPIIKAADSTIGAFGRWASENPAGFFALPFAVAGAVGAFGAGGAGASSGATAGGGGTAAGAGAGAGSTLAPVTTTATAIPHTAGTTAALSSMGYSVAPASAGMAAMPAVAGPASTLPSLVSAPPASGGLLSRVGGFVRNNPEIAGGLISGLGQGLLAGAQADAQRDAEVDVLRERQRLVDQNYEGADPGRSFRGLAPSNSGTTPAARFSPGYYSSFEFRFDPAQGRIVRVPINQ